MNEQHFIGFTVLKFNNSVLDSSSKMLFVYILSFKIVAVWSKKAIIESKCIRVEFSFLIVYMKLL